MHIHTFSGNKVFCAGLGESVRVGACIEQVWRDDVGYFIVDVPVSACDEGRWYYVDVRVVY